MQNIHKSIRPDLFQITRINILYLYRTLYCILFYKTHLWKRYNFKIYITWLRLKIRLRRRRAAAEKHQPF